MNITKMLLQQLQVPSHCLVWHWAHFYPDLHDAWCHAEPQYIAWLLVQLGYDFDQVIDGPLQEHVEEMEGKTPLAAHNVLCRFMQKTGITQELSVIFRVRFAYEEVLQRAAAKMQAAQ